MAKRLLLVVLTLAAGAALGFAQQLPVTGSAATLDGTVAQGEYAVTLPLGKMTAYVNRNADTIDMAISAPTAGWVALGFGSDRMDGARIFLGTVVDGKASLLQQRGSGHSHRDVTDDLPLRFAMSEAAGSTTLEVSFKASDVVATGQKELTILAAYGATDSTTAYHTARDRVTVTLQ